MSDPDAPVLEALVELAQSVIANRKAAADLSARNDSPIITALRLALEEIAERRAAAGGGNTSDGSE